MSVAGAGFLVNVAATFLLPTHAKESFHVRGAYLHVLRIRLERHLALPIGVRPLSITPLGNIFIG